MMDAQRKKTYDDTIASLYQDAWDADALAGMDTCVQKMQAGPKIFEVCRHQSKAGEILRRKGRAATGERRDRDGRRAEPTLRRKEGLVAA